MRRHPRIVLTGRDQAAVAPVGGKRIRSRLLRSLRARTDSGRPCDPHPTTHRARRRRQAELPRSPSSGTVTRTRRPDGSASCSPYRLAVGRRGRIESTFLGWVRAHQATAVGSRLQTSAGAIVGMHEPTLVDQPDRGPFGYGCAQIPPGCPTPAIPQNQRLSVTGGTGNSG